MEIELGFCHFTQMEYCVGESDDLGNFEEWLECRHCGHTCEVPTKRLNQIRRAKERTARQETAK